jgi:lysyl-tRNA synthetase class 2
MLSKLKFLKQRSSIVWTIRGFFHFRGFVEIDAPIIVRSPGLEPYLDAFEVRGIQTDIHHQAQAALSMLELGQRKYLQTSPEYALKKLLGQGFDRVFSICACFRDEPTSKTHQPEFTMLEWYVKNQNLFELMDQCEALLREVSDQFLGKAQRLRMKRELIIDGQAQSLLFSFDLHEPFERLSVQEAFIRYTGIDYEAYPDAQSLRAQALQKGFRADEDWTWDDIFFQLLMDAVEPKLGREKPTFLWGYPASQAALAKLDPTHPSRALRFELFIGGIELGNAFDELCNAEEQRLRFISDQKTRAQLGKAIYPIDEKLLLALPQMGNTTGIAIGLDRLVMLFTQAEHIADIRCQAWED